MRILYPAHSIKFGRPSATRFISRILLSRACLVMLAARAKHPVSGVGRCSIQKIFGRSAGRGRCYATSTGLDGHPKPGDQLHGFTLERSKHVPELQLTASQLRHDTTGAEYIHVARDDKNNVFSISFKTNPPNDTGVPHILEHTTLCGSERYPVRDPFFKMLPRSLSNFMNALTYSDHTTYPFATTNRKDFNNLMSVYLDATLHPLLKESDFIQEGWRIGPENPEALAAGDLSEAAKKLVFKGVVYNEMKGQMSDASYLYYIRYQDHIFPDIHNSGGDPQKMTNLTWDDLKAFHATNYHPSNAKIFTYGDMPLTDHLVEIDRQLKGFARTQADGAIKSPIRLEKATEVIVDGPCDPLVDRNMQYKTSNSWMMGDTSDVLKIFSLQVISNLLLDGYGSPLYRSLIEAGLGTDWSPNTGLDSAGKQGIFCIGLNGVKEENVEKVKEATQNVFREVHQKGFEMAKIEGILHQLELALKHKTAAFGMGLMQRLQPGWFNGVDPLHMLAWNTTVSAFNDKLAQGRYLEGIVAEYFLSDKIFTFTMKPSPTYGDEVAKEEAQRLASGISAVAQKSGGSSAAQETLTAQELRLVEEQNTARNSDLSCLPKVHVGDVPRQMEKKAIRDSEVSRAKVQWRETTTNGLTYFRAINTITNLPDDLRILIPLFADAILRIGTKTKTMEELEDSIKLNTGGIKAGYFSTGHPTDTSAVFEGISISGYAMDGNMPRMYDLLREIIQETNFDSPEAEGMVNQLIQSEASNALNAVASSGHAYARQYAEASLSPHAKLSEQVSGLTQIQNVIALASRTSNGSLSDVLSKLKEVQKFAITNSSGFRAAITCGKESVASNEAAFNRFITQFPSAPLIQPRSSAFEFSSKVSKTFFPLPYQVYYSGLAVPTVPYTNPWSARLQILSQLLTHKHLHHEIREKGGAYGAGAYSKGLDGLFGFYSYRDPNPENTLKIMLNAGQWARDREWSDEDIEEAKISVFQRIDAPESVSEEGMTRFLSGVDEDMEQAKREQLLDVSKNNVRDAAERFLVRGLGRSSVAVLGLQKGFFHESGGWDIREIKGVKA